MKKYASVLHFISSFETTKRLNTKNNKLQIKFMYSVNNLFIKKCASLESKIRFFKTKQI